MGDIVEGAPISYEEDKSERIITRFSLMEDEIVFNLNQYNKNKILVIDPALTWATYYKESGGNGFGGSGYEEASGLNTFGSDIWITGCSYSLGFPTDTTSTSQYLQGSTGGAGDVFILEFNTCGKLLWSTYYGGSTYDTGSSISSDGTYVWVTGATSSSNFPTLSPTGAYKQLVSGGEIDAFILQFNCVTGARIWASFYGGNGDDQGNSISSDGKNVWVTGYACSTDFPTKNFTGTYNQSVLETSVLYCSNAFILEFNANTSGLIWATYYGGSGGGPNYGDVGNSITSDGTNVWVTGYAESTDFPIKNLVGAYNQSALTTQQNAFLLQFNCATSKRVWATYYGGNGNPFWPGNDRGTSISSDGSSVWVTGSTNSTDFPLQNLAGAYNQSVPIGAGASNAFLLQFSCAASARIWATCYGGTNEDIGYSVQSDGNNVWVCGSAGSTDFPTLNPSDCPSYFQNTYAGGYQGVFVLQFSTSGTRKWATYYGNDGENDGSYICSDGANLFVMGDAGSSTYPTMNPGSGAFFNSTAGSGSENVFIGKFTISCSTVLTISRDTTICSGGSAQLLVGGGSGYTWLPGSGLNSTTIANPIATPTVTTTYTVSGATTGNTCAGGVNPSTATVTVTIPPALTVTATEKSPASCGKSDGVASVLASGGLGTLSYSWSNGPTAETITSLSAGSYTITVHDSIGCSKSSITAISNSPSPTINSLTETNILCNGSNTGSAVVTASGSTGLSYNWSNGGTGQTINNVPAGTYVISVTDVSLCSAVSAVSITQPPTALSIINVTTPPASCGPPNGSAEVNVSGGTGSYTFLWSGGATIITSSTAEQYSNLASNTYTLTLTDANGCTSSSAVTIGSSTTPPQLTADSSGQITCSVSSVTLTGTSAGNAMVWNGGTLNNAPNPAIVNAPGTYTVTATDASNGCTATTMVAVENQPGPGITSQSSKNTCKGKTDGAIILKTTGTNDTYTWSNGVNSSTGNLNGINQLPNLGIGNYTLTVTDNNGCTITTTATIILLPEPKVSAGIDVTITPGQSITLQASGGIRYLWTPAASLNNDTISNPIADPIKTTSYTVMVTDINNCSAIDSVLITVKDLINCDSGSVAKNIYVPGAFSPNGDGKNDMLYVRISQESCIATLTWQIYDRWGELVFATTNSSMNWNGTYKGQQLQTAVFVYYLTATLTNGQSIFKKGNVTLLR